MTPEPTPEARLDAVIAVVKQALHRYMQEELETVFGEQAEPLRPQDLGLGKPGKNNPELEQWHKRKFEK